MNKHNQQAKDLLKQIEFSGNILICHCGAVARAYLPQSLTVLDALLELLQAGIGYDCIAQAAYSFDKHLAQSRSNNLWDWEKGLSGYTEERGRELQGKIAQLFSTLNAKAN